MGFLKHYLKDIISITTIFPKFKKHITLGCRKSNREFSYHSLPVPGPFKSFSVHPSYG
uniref:Uncharacterized protein n=1 Tax=Rhizophora mucronata TaxID=61149 RepID=A0A2P2PMT1_RHIMU